MDKAKLVVEAKHSYALFMSFTMDMNYHEAMNNGVLALLLKWPDVVDDLLNDDHDRFYSDMRILIIKPIEIIADGLVDVVKMTGCHNEDFYNKMNEKIRVIVAGAIDPEHPTVTKAKLIECINETVIYINTNFNMKIKLVKERHCD